MIDVVVPCYRYGRYLRECVESVLTQDVDGLRVLIIDDASPDETPEVANALAREDARVSVVRHSANRGIIATLNEGVEWASGKYMLIISADDVLFPGALQRAIALMENHPDVGLTCGRALEVVGECPPDWRDRQVDDGYRIFSGAEFLDRSGVRNIVYAPTAVVRTALQKRVGGYRKELPHAADMEMWLRLAAYGPVGVIKAYQAVYRKHGENFSLAYATRYGLPDLEQRAAAVTCFIEACRHVLPNAERRRRAMLRLLSKEALGVAAAAFNDANYEMADELYRFALRTCPSARWSIAGSKVALRRMLGPSGWRFIEPLVRRSRRARRKLEALNPLNARGDVYRY